MSFDLGFSLLAVEDYEHARVAFENALDLVAGTDGRLVVAHATRGLGSVSAGLGDREEAKRLFEESIPMLEQMGDTTCLAFSHMYLSDVLGQSAMADTSHLLSEAFAGFREVNHQPGMAAVLRRLAFWVTESDPSLAARMLGAAGSLGGGVAQGLAPKEATFLGTIESSLAEHLGSDELRRFEEEAAGADVDSVVRQALALLTPPVESEPDSGVGESVRDHVGRRLAAIVMADIVGFSAQVAEDEAGTHRRIQGLRDHSIEPLLAAWNGRLVKTMGDGFLCEFASAVDAVECALAWQSGIGGDSGFVFRIGVAVGDIIVEGGDVFGDGVNVAARLESLAQPGGILVTGDAYRQVKGKVRADFEDLGSKELKNIPEPVVVYQAVPTR
jgi:class 3 adenylate cyclase